MQRGAPAPPAYLAMRAWGQHNTGALIARFSAMSARPAGQVALHHRAPGADIPA
jgi:hypothetical protein